MTKPNQTNLMQRRARRDEEGAVMLMTMFVVLLTTAAAAFAIHATSTEVRASGHRRQAAQTRQIGEAGIMSAFAWVDFYGADALRQTMTESSRANRDASGVALDLQPFEVALREGADAHRFDTQDFTNFQALPIDQDGSLGPRSTFDVQVFVDVYDRHRVVRAMPGEQAQGGGRLEFLGATYTARGRSRLPGDYQSGFTGDRPFHEGASDARAYGMSGPMARQ